MGSDVDANPVCTFGEPKHILMGLNFLATIDQALRYQRAPAATTWAFRDWEHNNDLLPKLQVQLEAVRDAYDKHDPLVYDTQGIRDDGAELIVRYRPESDLSLICFQVKSNRDISKPGYLQELKAQHYDAFNKVVGLEHYFILLCVDEVTNKDKVRMVAAEFRSAERTTVVEPALLVTFFQLQKTKVDALVTRLKHSTDVVFRQATATVDLEGPSASALAIYLAVRFVVANDSRFVIESLIRDASLRSLYVRIRDQQARLLESFRESEATRNIKKKREANHWEGEEEYPPVEVAEFEDQLAIDLSAIEAALVERESGSWSLRTEQMRPVSALMLDALVRYEYGESELLGYMVSLLGR